MALRGLTLWVVSFLRGLWVGVLIAASMFFLLDLFLGKAGRFWQTPIEQIITLAAAVGALTILSLFLRPIEGRLIAGVVNEDMRKQQEAEDAELRSNVATNLRAAIETDLGRNLLVPLLLLLVERYEAAGNVKNAILARDASARIEQERRERIIAIAALREAEIAADRHDQWLARLSIASCGLQVVARNRIEAELFNIDTWKNGIPKVEVWDLARKSVPEAYQWLPSDDEIAAAGSLMEALNRRAKNLEENAEIALKAEVAKAREEPWAIVSAVVILMAATVFGGVAALLAWWSGRTIETWAAIGSAVGGASGIVLSARAYFTSYAWTHRHLPRVPAERLVVATESASTSAKTATGWRPYSEPQRREP